MLIEALNNGRSMLGKHWSRSFDDIFRFLSEHHTFSR